jgi:hypothetical protein
VWLTPIVSNFNSSAMAHLAGSTHLVKISDRQP